MRVKCFSCDTAQDLTEKQQYCALFDENCKHKRCNCCFYTLFFDYYKKVKMPWRLS